MKQVIKIVIAAIVLFAAPKFSTAQKVAHINLDSLLKIMPDYQHIKDTLTSYSIQVQKTMIGMEDEFIRKSAELDSLKKTGTITPLMIQLREKQLSDMQQNYAAFAQAAEQEAAALQASLVEPLYDKIKKAVEKVAKANGYSYVIDSSEGGALLYADPAHDLFVKVCAELKITIPAPKPAGGAPAPAPAPR